MFRVVRTHTFLIFFGKNRTCTVSVRSRKSSLNVDWLHTAKLEFRNGLDASVGKSFVRHLRAVFYELTPDSIGRLKLRGCVVPGLFAPPLKSEYIYQ